MRLQIDTNKVARAIRVEGVVSESGMVDAFVCLNGRLGLPVRQFVAGGFMLWHRL